MEDLAQSGVLVSDTSDVRNTPRHTVLVRITHWINTFGFLALVASGVAILLAHPRLYWGETGAFGSPALIELPLPLNTDHSGWGRSLHFLAAWVCVLNGAAYTLSGLLTHHFRRNMLPVRVGGESETYNVLQRMTYLLVVFVLFPLMIVTGLAMSPAVTAVLPAIVGIFGGHQSARTVHFFATNVLVLFLIVHVAMVCREGFTSRMDAMIAGRGTALLRSRKERV
jgi:thiosulfate reductase cytochrome b subunit